MPRDKRNVESALLAKGFCLVEGDHHFFIYVTIEGKKTTVRTKTSHTPKMRTVPDNLLSLMARQCRLTKSQFLELVDCPMTREAYETELAEQDLT